MDRQLRSRRQLLRAGGLAAVTALAGCTGGGGGDGGGGNGTDGGDNSGGPKKTAFTPTDCEPETVSGPIEADTTWSAGECPRVAIDGNLRITNGATLTIDPGVEVVGKSGARITVKSDSALKAQGEAENPVWFYGETDATGYWDGIRFRSAADNVLDNVVLRNGGNEYANVYLDGNSTVAVTNTLSERCASSGLVATGGTTLQEFSNNAFRDNEAAAISVQTTHLGMIDAGSAYAGDNKYDAVYVNNASVGSEATWPSVPYRFEGSNHRLNAAVTVEAGASFACEAAARITVKSGGSLAVEGTSDDPVTFAGDTATTGYWDGIRLRSNNPNNSFNHVEIAHGGREYANIYLDDNSQASITNTLSEQCANSGIVATNGTTLREFSNNEFRENEFAAISVQTSHLGSVDAESTYAGENKHDAVYVNSSGVDSEATWAAAPYRFEGSNHRLNAAVTVDPGASFTFEEAARITVKSGGSLTAEGSSDATISFVGATETRGFWDGIRLRSNNPNNSFDNVDVAHGGNEYTNIYLDGNSQASVTNSTIRASASYGIVVTSGASLEASNNTFKNNAEGDIRNENN